ncbi:MAG: hypothetical protein GC201_17535 [Alphaproteobacteria bacterium]|nr:hypothetical protein [Alphaproteobacteria bacterium]
MDFRRNKTYHDILAEQNQSRDGHLVPNPLIRWLFAAGGVVAYAAALASLYWVSDVAFKDTDPASVPAWRHMLGLFLNTCAIGFSAIFLVSLGLWAMKVSRARYPVIFGTLGFIAGLLVASAL